MSTIAADDLKIAILAMDSYDQGYNPGMIVDSKQIGDASIIEDSLKTDPASEAYSFYAVAYSLDNQTIISYRGTTFAHGPDFGAVLKGWTLSAGFGSASQAALAHR